MTFTWKEHLLKHWSWLNIFNKTPMVGYDMRNMMQ